MGFPQTPKAAKAMLYLFFKVPSVALGNNISQREIRKIPYGRTTVADYKIGSFRHPHLSVCASQFGKNKIWWFQCLARVLIDSAKIVTRNKVGDSIKKERCWHFRQLSDIFAKTTTVVFFKDVTLKSSSAPRGSLDKGG